MGPLHPRIQRRQDRLPTRGGLYQTFLLNRERNPDREVLCPRGTGRRTQTEKAYLPLLSNGAEPL